MSITIELDAATEKWLSEESARRGREPERLVNDIIREKLADSRAKSLAMKAPMTGAQLRQAIWAAPPVSEETLAALEKAHAADHPPKDKWAESPPTPPC